MGTVNPGFSRSAANKWAARRGIHGQRIAGTKTGALGQTAGVLLSPTTVTGATYRVRGEVPQLTFNPRLIFANWYINGANGETDGPADITVKAALEVNGAFYPCTFNGQQSVTIKPGCQAICDPIGVMILAATPVYYRTYLTVAAGGRWPVSRAAATAIGEGANANVSGGSTGADAAYGTGAMAGNTLQNLYHPLAMIGETMGARAVGYLADSIGVGALDTTTADFGVRGPFERAFTNKLAWATNGRSSAMVTDFLARHRNRMAYFPQYVSSVVNELGSNDLYSGAVTTLGQMQTALRSLWTQFLARGVPIWQTTITPRVSSTDDCTTLAGQTIYNAAANDLRVQVNDWIRTASAAEGLAGVIDFADVVESARNSGLWRVDLGQIVATEAGQPFVHPNLIGNQIMSAAVPVAAFL